MAYFDYTLSASGAQTATFNSAAIDMSSSSQASFYLIVGTVTGTTPSLTVTLQDSPDGTNWFTLNTAFTAVVASTSLQVKRETNMGRYVRANCVITGTTPSFTFSVLASGRSKG